MRRSDWTLCAIGLAGDRGLSPVQLQKTLFLLGEERAEEVGPDFYQFIPYNYGPFDASVYHDASSLADEGFVSISCSVRGFNIYSITPKGARHAEETQRFAHPRAIEYLKRVVDWAQGLSFSQLVRAIYAKYPEYRENSVFQG
ncbi:MAG: hypothetical protein ABSE56_15100 [Bryobacteraceae bacterium]|jgi:DNA-binding PadR family transcriptional regulator